MHLRIMWKVFFVIALFSNTIFSNSVFAGSPDLFLLKNYKENKNIVGWVMSEKLDGIRGFWTGEQLISRSGKELNPPKFWTKNFPPFAIDGEIWNKRDNFDNISSIVRNSQTKQRWANLAFHIFEVPNQNGGLLDRLDILQTHLDKNPSKFIKIIPQITITHKSELEDFLTNIIKRKGEGVVVRNPNSTYKTGRLSSAMKVKKYFDTECIVEEILLGRGKYKNAMGSLKCKTKDNIIVTIGSGFTDFERENPPKIGTEITFKHYGTTKNNKFRFPVFIRKKQRL